jgi:hypothetical protein
MAKTLTQFLERSYTKQIDEEIVQAIVETIEEQDLTEDETDELIAELKLFGTDAIAKRMSGKNAEPFKVVHAGIAGAADRVKAKDKPMKMTSPIK